MATLKQVESNRDLKGFLFFPFWLYADNAFWVKPDISAMKLYFDRKKNPFFKTGDARVYVAMKDRRVAGRVAVFANRNELEGYEKILRFGFLDFENDSDVSQILFEAIRDSAKELGATRIKGCSGFADDDFEFATQIFVPRVILPNQRPDYFFKHLRNNAFALHAKQNYFVLKQSNQVPGNCKILTPIEAIQLLQNANFFGVDEAIPTIVMHQIQNKKKVVVACNQIYFLVTKLNKLPWHLPFEKQATFKSAIAERIYFSDQEQFFSDDLISVQTYLLKHVAQKVYFLDLISDYMNTDNVSIAGKIIGIER